MDFRKTRESLPMTGARLSPAAQDSRGGSRERPSGSSREAVRVACPPFWPAVAQRLGSLFLGAASVRSPASLHQVSEEHKTEVIKPWTATATPRPHSQAQTAPVCPRGGHRQGPEGQLPADKHLGGAHAAGSPAWSAPWVTGQDYASRACIPHGHRSPQVRKLSPPPRRRHRKGLERRRGDALRTGRRLNDGTADPGRGAALPRRLGRATRACWAKGAPSPRPAPAPGAHAPTPTRTRLSPPSLRRTPVSALGAFWTTRSASDYLGFQG